MFLRMQKQLGNLLMGNTTAQPRILGEQRQICRTYLNKSKGALLTHPQLSRDQSYQWDY